MSMSRAVEPRRSQAQRGAARFWTEVLLGFFCVFGGLVLPAPGLGPRYVGAPPAPARGVLRNRQLESGVRLDVEATPQQLAIAPWQATLLVQEPTAERAVRVPIDLRVLAFLPTAAFVALAVAVPLGSRRRHLRLLAVGLPLLELLLLALMAAPLLSFLGGTGPVQALRLGRLAHTLLQIVYRALVVPPGMTFALPLVLWYCLVVRLGFSVRNSNG